MSYTQINDQAPNAKRENRLGFALVMQVSCRDHNRIAIQGNVLGAAAMGVCNILCLTDLEFHVVASLRI